MGYKACALSILLSLSLVSVAHAENITSDAYFYGQSPPVYPSRALLPCPSSVSIYTNLTFSAEGTGSGSWASAYQKAKEFVGKLTPEEKVNLTAGISVKNGCSGNIGPIDHLGFPGICVSDAGNGLVSTKFHG